MSSRRENHSSLFCDFIFLLPTIGDGTKPKMSFVPGETLSGAASGEVGEFYTM
jgi:hypothetical protein